MQGLFESIAFTAALAITVAALQMAIGRSLRDAPGLSLASGFAVAIAVSLIGLAPTSANFAAQPAEWGLCLLAFAAACQLNLKRVFRVSAPAFRLASVGVIIGLVFWALTAFVVLPQMSFATAVLIAAALTLNGSSFNTTALLAAPAPTNVKKTAQIEGATTTVIAVPIALFSVGFAMNSAPNEAALAPLLEQSLSMLSGYILGGLLGVVAGGIGKWFFKASVKDNPESLFTRIDAFGAPAVIALIAAVAVSPFIGANPIIASLGVGLVWGAEVGNEPKVRRALQGISDKLVPPIAYFGFGFLVLPLVLEADLLSMVFAVSAVTILRVAPRSLALAAGGGNKQIPQRTRDFMAWYGGAPGVTTALFLIMLTGMPMISGLNEVLEVGALCVALGVLGTQLGSRPLLNGYIRASARPNPKRAFA